MFSKLKALWRGLPDGVKRVIHTAYQVALPVLVSQLYMARSSSDVKAAFVIAGAAGIAAVKALVVSRS